MPLAVPHDQWGPIETTYSLPIAVYSLGLLGSAAPLPNKQPLPSMARAQTYHAYLSLVFMLWEEPTTYGETVPGTSAKLPS